MTSPDQTPPPSGPRPSDGPASPPPKGPPGATRPPSQSPGAGTPKRTEKGKWGERYVAFQRWVVKRFWSLVVLTIAAQIGGYIGRTQFGIERQHGRTFTLAVLIGAGVIFYWLAPKRAKFMLNLCFLLLVGAAVLVGLPLLVQVARLGGIGEAWRSIENAFLTPLGMEWLMAGVVLLILLVGGRFVGAQMRTKSQSRGGFKTMKESQRSASSRSASSSTPGPRPPSPPPGSSA